MAYHTVAKTVDAFPVSRTIGQASQIATVGEAAALVPVGNGVVAASAALVKQVVVLGLHGPSKAQGLFWPATVNDDPQGSVQCLARQLEVY